MIRRGTQRVGDSSSGSLPLDSGKKNKRPANGSAGRNVATAARLSRLATSDTAPKIIRPATAPRTPATMNQPATDARTDVGNTSITRANRFWRQQERAGEKHRQYAGEVQPPETVGLFEVCAVGPEPGSGTADPTGQVRFLRRVDSRYNGARHQRCRRNREKG